MKVFMRLVSVIILCCVAFGSVSASALGGVNDFEIQNYQIDYYLAKDADNRSTLKTVETITADFPQSDQNHGIERAIPSSYDNHPTSLDVASVTDVNGASLNYETYDSNGNTVLRIGDADRYVHGRQTYKLTYTQRDVTKYFKDANVDEFYWDTNGVDWLVSIRSLQVALHVDDMLAPQLTGKQSCYFGVTGATTPCDAIVNNGTLTTSATNLTPGQNITIAVGFKPHTFAAFEPTLLMRLMDLWAILLVLTFPIASVLFIWVLIRQYRRSNRLSEVGTIVPEYLPPRDASVSTSATISRKRGSVFSAQLIDLAVRHYVKIYQTREKSFFRPANYELEIIKDISDLKTEEQEVLKDIFDDTSVGARLDMATLKRNRAIGLKLSDNQKKLNKSITGKYALRKRDDKQSVWFKRMALVAFILALLTFSPWFLAVALTSLIIGVTLKPLTDAGLDLARYLKGLEMYIKVAEAERLRMLQSPEGAEKVGAAVDTNDKRQLIKLYERVLPYAVLFGQEKEWNNQLGQYYESAQESPSWYSGHNAAFNAVVFSSAMHSFNQVASYSDPSSASSSGSSGGGSSGGGGGGGGGGGW